MGSIININLYIFSSLSCVLTGSNSLPYEYMELYLESLHLAQIHPLLVAGLLPVTGIEGGLNRIDSQLL